MDVQQIRPDLDEQRLRKLAAHHGPCLTAYAPVRVGDDAYIATQVRNCIREARAASEALGDRLAKAMEPLLDDLPSWDKSQGALAVFLGDDVVEAAWIPDTVERSVHVGERFHVTPFATRVELPPFAVVALQLGNWSAFRVRGQTVEEVHVDDAPDDIHDATREVVEPVPGGSSHGHSVSSTGAGTAVQTQGFGHEERRKDDAKAYFRALSGPLVDALGKDTPVVLVGNEPWTGMFARRTELDVVDRVNRNPGGMGTSDLVELAREQLDEELSTEQLTTRYAAAKHRTDDADRLRQMARAGGVDLLLLPEGTTSSMDDVVCDVLEHGGQVHTIDADSSPRAILRWSIR